MKTISGIMFFLCLLSSGDDMRKGDKQSMIYEAILCVAFAVLYKGER